MVGAPRSVDPREVLRIIGEERRIVSLVLKRVVLARREVAPKEREKLVSK